MTIDRTLPMPTPEATQCLATVLLVGRELLRDPKMSRFDRFYDELEAALADPDLTAWLTELDAYRTPEAIPYVAPLAPIPFSIDRGSPGQPDRPEPV